MTPREALELLGECADGFGEEADRAYDVVKEALEAPPLVCGRLGDGEPIEIPPAPWHEAPSAAWCEEEKVREAAAAMRAALLVI